ncbi:MAG: DUF2087 domain-containing protein [Bacteroidota bacterium]
MKTKYVPLKNYLDRNNKFVRLPGKRQKDKQHLMLVFLATKFEMGRDYTEQEVNQLLNRYHSFNDPATLRRLMFGKQLLDRTIDGKRYWRKG